MCRGEPAMKLSLIFVVALAFASCRDDGTGRRAQGSASDGPLASPGLADAADTTTTFHLHAASPVDLAPDAAPGEADSARVDAGLVADGPSTLIPDGGTDHAHPDDVS